MATIEVVLCPGFRHDSAAGEWIVVEMVVDEEWVVVEGDKIIDSGWVLVSEEEKEIHCAGGPSERRGWIQYLIGQRPEGTTA